MLPSGWFRDGKNNWPICRRESAASMVLQGLLKCFLDDVEMPGSVGYPLFRPEDGMCFLLVIAKI